MACGEQFRKKEGKNQIHTSNTNVEWVTSTKLLFDSSDSVESWSILTGSIESSNIRLACFLRNSNSSSIIWALGPCEWGNQKRWNKNSTSDSENSSLGKEIFKSDNFWLFRFRALASYLDLQEQKLFHSI